MEINTAIEKAREIVWGPWTVVLVVAAGCFLSFAEGWPQFSRAGSWLSATAGGLFRKRSRSREGISPFQSATAALAGSLGTGNIVGVASALALGGAGAIFWMWVAAVPGMMTACAENCLGVVYRRRAKDGRWLGGPMYYMRDGLGMKRLAAVWAGMCALSAFGVGNLVQVNAIAQTAREAWNVPPVVVGAVVAAAAAPAILGGVRSVTRLTERLVPFMAIAYTLACAAVVAINIGELPNAFAQIIGEAFSPSAAGGGFVGAMLIGVRRGVFTNEAGLGSSVVIHSATDTDSPALVGMWAMFEVFIDTIVMCTLTALAILTSGAYARARSGAAVSLSAAAFEPIFGGGSGAFIAVATLLFAFSTVVGWSCCGERAFEYLAGDRFGKKATAVYRVLYLAAIIPGCLFGLESVWAFSDLINGMLLIPNTAAVLLLSGQVKRLVFPKKAPLIEKATHRTGAAVPARKI